MAPGVSDGLPFSVAARHERLDEERDVVLPLAEGRQGNRDHAEAVIQVLAEAPSATIRFRSAFVAATRGRRADGLDRADGRELALLEDAQGLPASEGPCRSRRRRWFRRRPP